MNIANNWNDYKILDMADGQKLEKWGDVILSRPDPQIIWKDKSYPEKWKNINATYHRSKTGGGTWEYNKKMPQQWQIKYKDLTFNIKPMGFKHTGLFPEQAVNWDWMIDKIKNAKGVITVEAKMQTDEEGKKLVCVTVSDNGVGMDKETAQNFLTVQSKGYGARNVNDRIRLYYGESYHLEVQSMPDEGTTITIKFPAKPYNTKN